MVQSSFDAWYSLYALVGVVATNLVEFGSLLFWVTKIFRNFSEEKRMARKMYQGGSSRKQEPRLAIREPNDEPSREAQVQPHECPLEDFMVQAGIKDKFDTYVRNTDLESFVSD
jgi:hypothetical protein